MYSVEASPPSRMDVGSWPVFAIHLGIGEDICNGGKKEVDNYADPSDHRQAFITDRGKQANVSKRMVNDYLWKKNKCQPWASTVLKHVNPPWGGIGAVGRFWVFPFWDTIFCDNI